MADNMFCFPSAVLLDISRQIPFFSQEIVSEQLYVLCSFTNNHRN